MILLVSGATSTVRRMGNHPNLGRFLSPRNWNDVDEMATCGLSWAADNDCFQGLDPDAYLAMLDKIRNVDRSRLLFVTVPDVVADWHSTLTLFRYWKSALIKRELPLALVAQDGAMPSDISWSEINSLFIGGSTRWKMSRSAALLIGVAHKRNKWVHVGRVNSQRRIRHFASLGVDSIDGTQYSRYSDTYIQSALNQLEQHQPGLKELTYV